MGSGSGSGADGPVSDPQDGARPEDRNWDALLSQVDVDLQPILGIHTGKALGYEALLRVWDHNKSLPNAPVLPPVKLTDEARRVGRMWDLEAAALEAAFAKFSKIADRVDERLFVNVDPSVLVDPQMFVNRLEDLSGRYGIARDHIVIELSERRPFLDVEAPMEMTDLVAEMRRKADAMMGALRTVAGRIALDDFGAGQGGLPLIYLLKPDFIKLNRFFVSNLSMETTRRIYLRHLVSIAHQSGIRVAAVGVDDADDYYVCRDAGCDMIQGACVSEPISNPADIKRFYAIVRRLNKQENRGVKSDHHLVRARMSQIAPLNVQSDMDAVFDRFRKQKNLSFLPVVDALGEPLGIVRDVDLKDYAYSLYGKDLINNKALGRTLEKFLTPCPAVDIETPAEEILGIFSSNASADGLVLTQDGRYEGFLSAASLLRVINEKSVAIARDQNPLTKLPGNTMIGEFVADLLTDRRRRASLVYLDFDYFKPFNDKYGFRQGDRAILLFAELMKKTLQGADRFLAHVGGDDFFIGFPDGDPDMVEAIVADLIARFAADCLAFYDDETRKRGFMIAKDREGVERPLPLLAVSAAVIHLPPYHTMGDVDEIGEQTARLKKTAKAATNKMACYSFSVEGTE